MPFPGTHEVPSDPALAAALTDLDRALRSTQNALDGAIQSARHEPRSSTDDEPVTTSRDWSRAR